MEKIKSASASESIFVVFGGCVDHSADGQHFHVLKMQMRKENSLVRTGRSYGGGGGGVGQGDFRNEENSVVRTARLVEGVGSGGEG